LGVYSRRKPWATGPNFEFGWKHYDEIMITLGMLFRAEVLKFSLGGLQQKHNFWLPTRGKPRKLVIKLAGRRTFWPVVRRSNRRTLTAVPLCRCRICWESADVSYRHFSDWRLGRAAI
jgi:hypothetical protein